MPGSADSSGGAAPSAPPWWKGLAPFPTLRGYRRGWLRGDVLAALTVWSVLVPESLAYASIAGVSPVVGLYAAPAALVFYALLGSSRHLVTGPMSATAALSAAAVADIVSPADESFVAYTALLALFVGVGALLAGALRLGFLANFISEPVMKGFIVGLAMTIVIGQVPKLIGVEKTSGEFFEQLWGLLQVLGDTQALTLSVGVLSLAGVLALRRFAPALPGSLLVVLASIAAVAALDLDADGLAIVGHIQSGLPSIGAPDADLIGDGSFFAAALGVMLVGFAEGLGAARNYAARDHYEIDVNRELLGLGAANLASGMTSGMVVNGSLSKTAVNGSAGARTQLSGLIVAALTVLTLLLLTGLFEQLPEATLAAVVIAAVIELIDVASLRKLYLVHSAQLGRIYGRAGSRPDFLAAVCALGGVLVLGTLPGLFIGIGASLLLLLYRVSRPNVAVLGRVPGASGQWGDVARSAANEPAPGVVVARPESGLFFGNSSAVRTHLLELSNRPGTRAVVLDTQTMPYVDVSAATMLAELHEQLAATGVRLLLTRDVGQVRDVLGALGETELLDDVYPDVESAVRAASDAAGRGEGGGDGGG